LTTPLPIVASLLYLGAWGMLLRAYLVEPEPAARPPPTAALVTLAGLAVHGLVLYRATVTVEGIDLGFFNAVSLTAWVIAAMLYLTAATRPVTTLGLFVLPLVAVAVLAARAFHTTRVLGAEAGLGVQAHALTSVLASSVLAIAACQALVLYVQERRLRDHRPGRMTRVLPPLQLQETLLVQMLAVGFFLLSLSLATGLVFVRDLLAQHLVHKTVLSSVAWLVFAVVLWGRWRHGWRGRTLIRWSVGGFVVLMLAYFGSKLVLEVLLGRTWSAP
jgi:ABC-type uncharacterized transport system permease subunit